MAIISDPPNADGEFCPHKKDRAYSRRRAIYVYVITLFILSTTAILVFRGYTGPLVELFVRESLTLLGSVVLLYLGAGVIDRSRVLDRLGEGFRRPPPGGNVRTEETTISRTVADSPPRVPVPPLPGERLPIPDPIPNPVASGTIHRRRVG